MTLSDNEKRLVCDYIRRMKRDQVSSATMRPDLVRHITEEGYIVRTLWPSWVLSISERGLEFLRENDE